MEEKRTIGEFIKANKKKVVAGALIVLGLAAGIIVVVKTVKSGAALDEEGMKILNGLKDGLTEGTEVLGDATNI